MVVLDSSTADKWWNLAVASLLGALGWLFIRFVGRVDALEEETHKMDERISRLEYESDTRGERTNSRKGRD